MARAACGILPRAAGFRCAHCWTAAGELFAIASLGSLLAAEPSYALRIVWLHRIVVRHAAASQRGSVRRHCAGRAGQQLGAALQLPGAESKENACGKTSVRTIEFRFEIAHGGTAFRQSPFEKRRAWVVQRQPWPIPWTFTVGMCRSHSPNTRGPLVLEPAFSPWMGFSTA